MKIVFLGTGAADFLPSLADEDRFTIDKSIRRSSAALIDEKVLIDCGPHVIDEINLFDIDVKKIESVLITHDHSDHFNADNISCFRAMCGKTLNVYHSVENVMPQIEGVCFHALEKLKTYEINGFSVTPLAANHSKGAVHYSIEKDGKKIFYGCDGAWLLMDTYYYMRNKNYDVMILDATVGDYDGDFRMAEHNSIPMIRMMTKSFSTFGIMSAKTKIILDHLARTLHKPHAEVCGLVEKDGYIVAYDGMRTEV